MGQNQSTDDPALSTVSPGGTAHLMAPRSHPNTSSLNPSTSGPSMQPPAPLLQQPNAANKNSNAASPAAASPTNASAASAQHPQPMTANGQAAGAEAGGFSSAAAAPVLHPSPPLSHLQSSPTSDMMQPAPSPTGPSSLSQQVRDLIDSEQLLPSSASYAAAAAAGSAAPVLSSKVETVPSAFKWIHGGKEVFVTGSFNSWQGKILMQRMDDNEFSLIIDIPPGTQTYRYIVDQQWRYDEDAPMTVIDNVIYNVVEVKRPVFEYPPANYADSDDDDADERKQKTAYAQQAPQVDDYVKEPIKLPPQLTRIILNHDMDGQLLPVPEHVVLNHLYVLPSIDSQLLVTGITQRFKPNSHAKITHKFVTTVYYQPKPAGDNGTTVGMGLPGTSGNTAMQYQQYAGSGMANGSMHGAMMG